MAELTLEELRAWAAAEDDTAAKEAEALEFEAFTLRKKYHDSGKKIGVDFAIVTTLVGNFVVRNPEFLVAKKFAAVAAADTSVEDVIHFVSPCVLFPENATHRQIFQDHAGVAWRLAGACMKLHAAEADQRKGK